MTRLTAPQYGGVVTISAVPEGTEIRDEATGILLGVDPRDEAETVAAHLTAGWLLAADKGDE